MFHIDMRYSSFPADDSADFSGTYGVIRTDIKHAIQIACGHGLIPFGENSGKGTLLSIWSVGDIDLEDMTTIIEGIPELQANWLRTEVNALKIRAGLSPDDLPYLNRDWNHREGSYVTGGEFVRREWYSSGWMSAKGGTLKFDAGAPPEILATVSEGLRRKGATGTFGCFTMDKQTLRFLWNRPHADFWETRNAVREITDCLPRVPRSAQEASIKPARFRAG
jgi:hypothetical protein